MRTLGLLPSGRGPAAWGQALLQGSPVRPPGLWTWPQAKARWDLAEAYLVDESEQTSGSFKLRAAWACVAARPHPHFLTASSGNFALGLAKACRALGRRCTVVMPLSSDPSKVAAVKAEGAHWVGVDTSLEPRSVALARWARALPEAFVASPFDDEAVIAGNATLGLAIGALQPDVVLCPLGGGGLAAGVWEGLHAAWPQAELWGVEPAVANDVAQSWRRGRRVALTQEPDTLADGVRTLQVGEAPWRRLKGGLAGVVELAEAEIAGAFSALRGMGLHPEPTAALAPGALWREGGAWRGRVVCAIVCGGNVASDRAAAIAQAPATW